MIRLSLALTALLTVAAAGCAGVPTSPSGALRRSAPPVASASKAPSAAPSTPAASALTLRVNAPAELAGTGTGAIQAEALAASQGGVIAIGAGHVIAIGAGHYRLLADPTAPAVDGYRGVEQAFVRLEDAAGTPLSDSFPTDAQGQVSLGGALPSGQNVMAVAHFKVSGKTYRLAVPLRPDASGTLYLDPINTMLAAAFRSALAEAPERKLPSAKVLKLAWAICNEGGVKVPLADLEQAKDWAAIKALYRSLAQQLPEGDARTFVESFMDATDEDADALEGGEG